MTVPSGYLRISRSRLRKGGLISDVAAMRGIAIYLWGEPRGELDQKLFEEIYCTQSIETDTIRAEEIEKRLGVPDVNNKFRGIEYPIIVSGDSLKEKLESILPPWMNGQSRSALVLVLGHILLNDVQPNAIQEIIPQGLNLLAAGILVLNNIAYLTGRRIHWLLEVWSWQIEEIKRKILQRLLVKTKRNIPALEFKRELERCEKILSTNLIQDPSLLEKIPEWKIITESVDEKSPIRESLRTSLRKSIQKEWNRLGEFILGQQAISFRADTLVRKEHRRLMQSFSQSINILRRREVYDIFAALVPEHKMNQPTISKITKITGFSTSTAIQFLNRTAPAIIEKWVPTPLSLGLEYRCIIGSQRSIPLPIDGKIASKVIGAKRRNVTLHIEPIGSPGPSRPPEGSHHLVMSREMVSFRIDLFNRDTGKWSTPWIERTKPSRIRARAFLETPVPKRRVKIPPRAFELLSVLWAIRTSKKGRLQILRHLALQSVMAEIGRSLVEQKILGIIYHPSLQLVGLPKSLCVAASGLRKSTLNQTTEWLSKQFPFARILYGNPKRGELGDLIAELRLPSFSRAITREIVTNRLRNVAEYYLVEPILSSASYYLSGLYRAYDFKRRQVKDPWTH